MSGVLAATLFFAYLAAMAAGIAGTLRDRASGRWVRGLLRVVLVSAGVWAIGSVWQDTAAWHALRGQSAVWTAYPPLTSSGSIGALRSFPRYLWLVVDWSRTIGLAALFAMVAGLTWRATRVLSASRDSVGLGDAPTS